ncbi:hypothetical protein RJ640_004896 [Escallonia rubra]|uniref:Uncharacterized protein n=1 Tax=Escallonia rubra TaxID=112253 RepID=A0AA88R250_9ASTE|nr:hypothetical protein RJ640_004896 [Escallonia rubra]
MVKPLTFYARNYPFFVPLFLSHFPTLLAEGRRYSGSSERLSVCRFAISLHRCQGHLKIPKEEEMTEGKRQTRKFAVPKLDINEIKNQPSAVQHVPSPVQRGGSAEQPSSSHSGTRTSNCLCSPTTHPGSFRCRLHRNVGLGQGGGSAGSSPSE